MTEGRTRMRDTGNGITRLVRIGLVSFGITVATSLAVVIAPVLIRRATIEQSVTGGIHLTDITKGTTTDAVTDGLTDGLTPEGSGDEATKVISHTGEGDGDGSMTADGSADDSATDMTDDANANGTVSNTNPDGTAEKTEATADGDDGSDGTDKKMESTGENLPPVTWELVTDGGQNADMQAIREDLLSSAATNDTASFLSWPVLPYPVRKSTELYALIDMLYSEEPELSVMTNGQIRKAEVILGRYHMHVGDGQDGQDSCGGGQSEMGAVQDAVDALSDEIDDEITKMHKSMLDSWAYGYGHGADYLYATWAMIKLVQRCPYSDGIDDTEHTNDVYGALVEHESKCYGVACAAKLLLDKKGIPSFVASGTMGEGRHAVTYLWVEDGWHVIDVTSLQHDAVPTDIGWHVISMPFVFGTGIRFVSVHDFSGNLGKVVTPREDYEEKSGFQIDERCEELMAAYEKLIGVTGN